MPTILVLRRLRQVDWEFEVRLGYKVRLRFRKTKHKQREGRKEEREGGRKQGTYRELYIHELTFLFKPLHIRLPNFHEDFLSILT
jgi:hypothetical protein